ncbi:MAG: TatD family hydrolase [Bacillota bacterium]
MTGQLVDTHVHLDLRQFDRDRSAVMERAAARGVVAMINVGFDVASSRRAVELASQHHAVWAACGIHPHYARGAGPEDYRELEELLEHERVIALGEIGLDYYRDLSPRPVQREVFRRLLSLARDARLPVIIHDRDAHQEVLAMLQDAGGGELAGIMHCFSGDWAFAEQCLALGFYVSIAGTVTYPNALGLREVTRRVPESRLLLETDCPWLAPAPYRGKRNEPAFVALVAEEVARIRDIKPDQLARTTTENACRLFGINMPASTQAGHGSNCHTLPGGRNLLPSN